MANSLYEYDYYGDEAGEAEGESMLARLVRLMGGGGGSSSRAGAEDCYGDYCDYYYDQPDGLASQ